MLFRSKRSVGTNGYSWNDMELMTRAWDATGEIEYECLTPVSEYRCTTGEDKHPQCKKA